MPKNELHISDLTFDPQNARRRTLLSSGVIQKSLENFGPMRSIVIDHNNIIRAGNGTIEEAGQLGFEKVIVVEADGDAIVAVRRRGLTEEQWKQYAIADNTASDFSSWDAEILKEISEEVDLGKFFPDDKLQETLAKLGGGMEPPAELGEDDPKSPDEVRVREGIEDGSIWQLGQHFILCGYSDDPVNVRRLFEVAGNPPVKLLLTNLALISRENILESLGRLIVNPEIFIEKYLIDNGPDFLDLKNCHDAIKQFSDSGNIVFNPFLTSGTSLIACEQTGRVCLGCEASLEYFEVILQRWEALTGREVVTVS